MNAANSYFRLHANHRTLSPDDVFPFCVHDVRSAERAWADASDHLDGVQKIERETTAKIVVWRRPEGQGPWSRVCLFRIGESFVPPTSL